MPRQAAIHQILVEPCFLRRRLAYHRMLKTRPFTLTITIYLSLIAVYLSLQPRNLNTLQLQPTA